MAPAHLEPAHPQPVAREDPLPRRPGAGDGEKGDRRDLRREERAGGEAPPARAHPRPPARAEEGRLLDPGVERELHELLRRRPHRQPAPRHAPLRRSSSSPAVHTLPAPSVSTTSPSRTSAASRSVADFRSPAHATWRWPRSRHRPRQRLRRDAGDRLLGGGVDVGQQEHVGLVEGLAEVVPEGLRARVAVRLEEHHRAPLARAAAQRLEGGADLGRVVAVVVDHQHARPPRPAPGSAGRRR